MKFLVLILISFYTLYCSAQNIKGTINLGANLTQVDGDEVFGFHKTGLSVGPSAIIPTGKFSFSIETLFNQKGAFQKATRPTDQNKDSGSYSLKLTYIDIPVLAHFTDKDILTIGAGISWGRLVNAVEKEHGKQTTTTARNSVYSKNDWNVLLDLRFRIIKKIPNLYFNFRYAYSIARIRSRIFLNGQRRDQYNNVLTARLIWILNNNKT